MSVVSLLVYIPQLVFVPLAIVGAGLVGYRQLAVSKRLGVSHTAIEIINGRWTMHVFGMRRDDATAALAAALPNTSTFGLWLCLFPLWFEYKLSGRLFLYPRVPEPGRETIADLVPARTLYFDRVIGRLMGEAAQFVLMAPATTHGPTALSADRASPASRSTRSRFRTTSAAPWRRPASTLETLAS